MARIRQLYIVVGPSGGELVLMGASSGGVLRRYVFAFFARCRRRRSPFRWVGTKHLRTIRLTGQLAFTVAKADILVFQGLDIAEVAKGLVVGISDYIT
jgi:hypothetical protein